MRYLVTRTATSFATCVVVFIAARYQSGRYLFDICKVHICATTARTVPETGVRARHTKQERTIMCSVQSDTVPVLCGNHVGPVPYPGGQPGRESRMLSIRRGHARIRRIRA
eukprot:scaffold26000_cov18-Prasinocladus_malaysianus.AAC.1